jgi:hypothetical protein
MDIEYVNKLEQQISDNKKIVDKANALTRLRNNPDFQEVVLKGYLNDLALKTALFKGSPACIGHAESENEKELIAIGRFNHYLNTVAAEANAAVRSTEDCYRAIAEEQDGTNDTYQEQ